MAIPRQLEVTKIKYLQDIIDAATPEELGDFPMPTSDDFALVGALIAIFSYIDFNFLRIADVMDQADMVEAKYKGKIGKLNINEVEEIVKKADWSEENLKALDAISELRPARNLLAHFTLRRFPNHDAYFLVTKSARDFKQVFGRDPEPGTSMTAVFEAQQLRSGVKEAERLVAWFSKAASSFERQWIDLQSNVGK